MTTQQARRRTPTMWCRLLMAAALTALLYPLTAPAAKSEKAALIPIRDFFKNPEVCCFDLSPDGKQFAYLKPWEKRMNVFVRPVAGGEEKRVTSLKDRDVAGFFWKENHSILYSRDFGGDENYHVVAVDLKTMKEKDLTPWPGVRAGVEDDLEDISADEILVSHNKRNKEVFDVVRINLRTGKESLVAQNPGGVASWLTDHKGRVRVAVESDGVNTKILYRDQEGKPFRVLRTMSFKDEFTPIMFTFDNKRLFVMSNIGRDKTSIVEYDPATNKELRILAQHPEYDMSGLRFSKKRQVLTSASVVTWKPEALFFDLEVEGIYKKLSDRFPGMEIRLTSRNRDENLYVVRTYSDRSQGAFYLYDVKKDETKELARLENLPSKDLAEVKPIEYTSRDGLTIHGYLTLPKGVDPKKLPLVVNPHGGPWARDVWGFNPEVQMLANRGFAVLQMNFRGSTGYGRKFWEASFRQWGKTMQNDVSDGVKWLVDQGIADSKRVCIYGASYGGYATLAGLAFTPELYACGVDYVGVANLFTFMKTIPPYWKPFLDQMYEMVGNPEKDKELMQSASPVFHVDKIKAPLFVVQGAKDPRVNKDESDQMVAALKKRGVEVPYLVKEDEGHGFHNEENRFEFYEQMEKFLTKHIGK